MSTKAQVIDKVSYSTMSMRMISTAAAFAAITHAYIFGAAAFVAGAIVIALIYLLGAGARTGNKVLLVVYSLLNLWIIIGFGVINGFWSHGVKSVIALANGRQVPPGMEGWFMDPQLGSVINECSGIASFVAAAFAAYYGFHFVRAAWKGTAST